MSRLRNHYAGKKVLLTGHTGFKGSWMAEWLLWLGAEVVGVSLEPEDDPSLFDQLGLTSRVEHHIQDIRDAGRLAELVKAAQPDIVFHLAAQPLVRYSYEHPVETFNTNVMGTVHVLDALRELGKACEVVIITTDKCYENKESSRPYAEDDPMGGYDPYSASKGACELVVSSYRRSFFHPDEYGTKHQVAVASARAGNVIGGGDWAMDRIVPDCMRTLAEGNSIPVRNPYATRPWQHVLEPLGGYLVLAMKLAEEQASKGWKECCSGFNFGPDPESNRSVGELVEQVLTCWPGTWDDQSDPEAVHEAGLLNLSIEKADRLLQWKPVWNFKNAIDRTVQWYHLVDQGADPLDLTRKQIGQYMELLSK
ncbi:CDP-glucose 4,6-dehydratase [Pontiellaceae bacterium B12227]|nr:CDP-glucose 4,6-dehydratase [Pontiellaceae bacterium B12227]